MNPLPDGYQCFIIFVSKLELTTPDYLMSAIPVMIVLDTAIVDQSGEVGVLMVVRTIVIAVGVADHCQP